MATWTVTISGRRVKFTNGAGQTLTMYSSGNTRYFYATTDSSSYQSFTPVDVGTNDGGGFRFYMTRSNRNYYMTNLTANNGRINAATSSNNAMVLKPMTKVTKESILPVQDWAYEITNSPLPVSNETSVTVKKEWNIPEGYDETLYQEFAVTVRLLANGVNTGRSVTLTLKNNWQGVFQGLPYKDEVGNVIQYTVEEIWEKARWSTTYGEITASGGSPPHYSTVITNTYYPGGPELPSTGSATRLMYVLCGSAIMLGTLLYGIGLRRKRERKMK